MGLIRLELTPDDHEFLLEIIDETIEVERDTFADDPDPGQGGHIVHLEDLRHKLGHFVVV